MRNLLLPWIKNHAVALMFAGGGVGYVLVSGLTGSNTVCSTIVHKLGLGGRSKDAVAIEAITPADAPAWKLLDPDGKEISSESFMGKVVVLDFWATWCTACIQEIPGYIELQKKYGKDGFSVIGVSLDENGSVAMKKFINANELNYPVVMGDAKTADTFGVVDGLPTTFVVNREGKIVARHTGYADKESFEAPISN